MLILYIYSHSIQLRANVALSAGTSDGLCLLAGQLRLSTHRPPFSLLSVCWVARPSGVVAAQRIDEYPLQDFLSQFP